jgi:pyruvate/2-oxoacid:ferredoxin oxidoreductase beta subunit
MSRGMVTNKWTRICTGCGKSHHINALQQMDGNECCPGERFSRDKTEVSQ